MTMVRFLGTSAGEMYPGIWCRCRNRDSARRSGGSSLRQSAAVALGDLLPFDPAPSDDVLPLHADTLIDFPPEIVSQAWKWGVDLSDISTLLVTRSHGDHLFPYVLRWRMPPDEISADPSPRASAPRFTALPTLQLYGNTAVEARLRRELGPELSWYDIEFTRVTAFARVRARKHDGYASSGTP